MKNFAIAFLLTISTICSGQTTCESDGGVWYRQNHYSQWQKTNTSWVLELASKFELEEVFPISKLTHAVIVPTKSGKLGQFQSFNLGKYQKTTSNGDGYVTVSFLAENDTVFQIILNEKLQMDAFIMLNPLGGDIQCQCKS